MNHSMANRKERSILTPIAISVIKTLFSGFLTNPEKKIKRAVSEITVKPPVRGSAILNVMKPGEIMLRLSRIERASAEKISRNR